MLVRNQPPAVLSIRQILISYGSSYVKFSKRRPFLHQVKGQGLPPVVGSGVNCSDGQVGKREWGEEQPLAEGGRFESYFSKDILFCPACGRERLTFSALRG